MSLSGLLVLNPISTLRRCLAVSGLGRAQRRRRRALRPRRPDARSHGDPRRNDLARRRSSESRAGRQNLDPGESAGLPVRALPAGVGILERIDQPAPGKLVLRCKTWTPKCAMDGLTVTVPKDAQQMLVFLAPEAGGDFKTLMGAVRGRPGAFVRTSQDLNQAALDRSRLERYLATIRALNDADPEKLSQVAPLLARSLAIKVDEKCLDRIPGAAGSLPDGGSGIADSQRRPQHLHRRGADLGARQRPCDGSELHAATELRLLQPVHRIGARYCEDPGLLPHGAISVHSRRSLRRTATSSISR
jgi:hypothetical protein